MVRGLDQAGPERVGRRPGCPSRKIFGPRLFLPNVGLGEGPGGELGQGGVLRPHYACPASLLHTAFVPVCLRRGGPWALAALLGALWPEIRHRGQPVTLWVLLQFAPVL